MVLSCTKGRGGQERADGPDMSVERSNGSSRRYFVLAPHSTSKWVPSLCALTMTTCLAAAANASQALNADHGASVEVLDAIVVTSTRSGSARGSHAGNISRLDGEQVESVQADHVQQLVNRLPGVNVQRGNGQEHLTAIRSPVLTGGAGAGSFLYLEDGVPMRAAGFSNVNGLFDAFDSLLDSVEVVRGPGSALYGSNAVHGMINFISHAPAQEPEALFRLRFGPHGRRHVLTTASSGFGQQERSKAVRASYSLAEDGGFQDESGFSQHKFQLRHDFATAADTAFLTLSAMNLNQETAGYVQGRDAYRNDLLRKTNSHPEAFRDAWALRGALHWTHDLNERSQLSVTPYARVNHMQFRMHYLPSQAIEENGHWSIGLQSAYRQSFGQGHKLILGADLEYSSGYLSELQTDPDIFSFEQGLHYDYSVDAINLSPYLHASWSLADSTELTTGLRLDYTHYDYDNQTADGYFGSKGRFLRTPDRSDRFLVLTPKLGLSHRFSDDLTGFLNLSRGARAPQATDLYRMQFNQVPGEARAEILDSIEIGARGRIAAIQFDVSAFHMKKKNFFFRDANNENVIDGRTRHYGLELELFRTLGDQFDITLAGSYAIHQYDFDRDVGDPNNNIASGDDVDTAPRTLANMRLGYMPSEDVRIELEWMHLGEYFTDPGNQAAYPGHDLFNLRGTWDVSDTLRLSAAVSNLFDVRYAERADFNQGVDRYFVGEDRALHVGATLRF